jgi:tripartite-type tricarboxylate transporter receptor subunit TctC
MMTGIEMVHVPYRGGAPAQSDLIAGQVQVGFFAAPDSIELVKSGKLRALAVTSSARSHVLPDVPTIDESVSGYEASTWFGIGAPANVPAEIVARLNREINASIADPTFKGRLTELGGTPLLGSPADFRRFIIEETEKWARVVKAAGLRPD